MVTDFNRDEILQAVDLLLLNQKQKPVPFIIGIDGRCASGKTSLANALGKRLNCDVIHLDDFFLQVHQRTPKRYKEPGGNLDRERVLEEVLLPLQHQHEITYGIFDCTSFRIQSAKTAKANPFLIIEGSYAFHPLLRPYYNIKIFADIDPLTQSKRLQVRSPQKYSAFVERWIPLEEAYFQTFDPKCFCDLIV